MHHTHNIIFALPLSVHIGFAAISTVLLLFCYIKSKHKYDLYMLIGVLSTLLIDFLCEPPYIYLLGAEEFILLILTILDMRKTEKTQKELSESTEETAEETNTAAVQTENISQ